MIASSASAQSTKEFENDKTTIAIEKLEKKKKTDGLSKHEKEKLKYLKRKRKIEAKRKKKRAGHSEFNKGH